MRRKKGMTPPPWAAEEERLLAQVNTELSQHVAKSLKADPSLRWYNAWRALAQSQRGTSPLYLKQLKDGFYVEGWIVVLQEPLAVREHGWIAVKGRIVDPTPHPVDIAYFPGIRFSWQEASEVRGERDVELPFARHYGAGLGMTRFISYQRAELEATEFAAKYSQTEYTVILNYLRKTIAQLEQTWGLVI